MKKLICFLFAALLLLSAAAAYTEFDAVLAEGSDH